MAKSGFETGGFVTVPPLAADIWLLRMMSPEAQKVNPFFLGGDDIIVAFPTDAMSQEEKVQSLRANNRHFARATVFHELIPGHHLQYYYRQRANPATGAGLIITEGTSPSPNGLGYPRIPGIFSAEQVAAWKKVTDKVHAGGAVIPAVPLELP